jgi:dihydrolipoamide dehydrogenase
VGCIPSKALLESSELLHLARHHFEEHGVMVGETRLDLDAMMRRKNAVVLQLVKGVSFLLKQNGIDHIRGTGSLTDSADIVQVETTNGTQELKAEKILLATGSEPVQLPALPFRKNRIVSSTEALSLTEVPARLVVVGGGAIGLEMGSLWSRLGSEVTVVEMLDEILPGFDRQISAALRKSLENQGLRFLLSSRVTGIEQGSGKEPPVSGRGQPGSRREKPISRTGELVPGMKVLLENGETDSGLDADLVLVAVGRRPSHGGMDLESLGVRTDRRGFVQVDQDFRTSREEVYAIGDLVGGAMLAHKAEDEGVVCVERMSGIPSHMRYDTVPNVVYTAPEAAGLGATEQQLQEQGVRYTSGRFSFKANGRALAMGQTDGMVKILADSESDRLLGVHIAGPWASALIAEAVAVMEFGGSAEDVGRIVHAHPTLSETVREAALDAGGRALHAVSRRRS